jgi:hypothetical protein
MAERTVQPARLEVGHSEAPTKTWKRRAGPAEISRPCVPPPKLPGGDENDAESKPLEEPVGSGPRAYPRFWLESPPLRVARPHTSLASLFAARFRVWIQRSWSPERAQPRPAVDPALTEEKRIEPGAGARLICIARANS